MIPKKNLNKTSNKFHCETCDYYTCRKSQYDKHLLTYKHQILTNPNKKLPNDTSKFQCASCDYYTCRKSQYDKHLTTIKHQNLQKPTASIMSNKTYSCICGKIYKHLSTLCAHKKKCISEVKQDIPHIPDNSDKLLIMSLVKENNEFKNMMMKVIENGTHNTTNNNNISNNKTFNLHFFLNETCKDAMNIMDFVESIQPQLSDLENVGKLGYVEGITNIITKNLKALDVTQRPVHCADKKREVLYVKDENKWEKEDDNKKKIRKAIKSVVSKNQRLIPKFKEAHPDCGEYSSRFSDQYDHIILESMGGSGDNDIEKEDKIIRNISSVSVINKA